MIYSRGEAPNRGDKLEFGELGVEHIVSTGIQFIPYISISTIDLMSTSEVTLDPAVGYVTTMNLNLNIDEGGGYKIGTSGTYAEMKELYDLVKARMS